MFKQKHCLKPEKVYKPLKIGYLIQFQMDKGMNF